MSAFGKYGTGGKVPGNWKDPADSVSMDFSAFVGTTTNSPNDVGAVGLQKLDPGDHNTVIDQLTGKGGNG